MPKQKLTKFNMSFADLEKLANEKVAALNRDIVEFEKFEILPVELQTLIDALVAIPTDEELLADHTEATKQKNKTEEDLSNTMGTIAQHVANSYSDRSSYYRKLGIHNLSQTVDFELKKLADRVVRVAPEILDEFVPGAKWSHLIAELHVLIDKFVANDKAQHDAEVNRELKTEDRNEAGNNLYEFLVKVCNNGKKIWKGKSEAKYNDYIIYDTPDPTDPTTTQTTTITK